MIEILPLLQAATDVGTNSDGLAMIGAGLGAGLAVLQRDVRGDSERHPARALRHHLGLAAPGSAGALYLLRPAVVYAGGAAGLAQIGLQKWLALYGNSVEAYSEWRRTGYPNLVGGPNASNGGQIPVRLPYPTREASLNGDNLEAAITRQGGASLNDEIWWDQ